MNPFWVFALILIGAVGLTWLVVMRLTVRRGALRVCERALVGAAMVFAASLLLRPFGVTLCQSPLTALSAGFFGIPGIVGCLLMMRL